jgi:hypothetical protein
MKTLAVFNRGSGGRQYGDRTADRSRAASAQDSLLVSRPALMARCDRITDLDTTVATVQLTMAQPSITVAIFCDERAGLRLGVPCARMTMQ